MLNKQQKIEQVAWIKGELETKPLVVFTTYRGLNITDMTALRRELKGQGLPAQAGISFKVVKSSLLKIALKSIGLDLPEEVASLPLAIAAGTDEVMPAKLIAKFIKDHEPLQIVGGVIEQKLVGAATVNRLALLPSRDELYAKLVGALKSPASRLINAMSFPGRGLTILLKQKFSL